MAMLARLQAEDALLTMAVAIAGNPFTDADVRKRIMGSWQAEIPRRRAKPERLTPEQFAERMQMLGMVRVQ